MNHKKILSAIFAVILGMTSAGAQINVSAPSVVGLNEQFRVTFTLTEKPSSFEWNPSDDFQLIWGPQTGSNTSISIVNGKTTKNSSYTYTYILLPASKGIFFLPAARAVVSGSTMLSKELSIEVVGDGTPSQGSSQSTPAQSQSQSSQPERTPRTSDSTPSSDMFLSLSLSKNSVVQGEPITATLKLYTRGGVSGFDDAKFPVFNGFWSQEIDSPQNITFRRESLGDKIYDAAVLRRWILIPQRTGTISIDPAELVCLVQQRVSTGNSIFDGFFDDFQTVRRKVTSPGYKVNVSPLPSGAPASFNGAVGEYRISASMSADSMKVHDAASLKIVVSGKGNVALVAAPKVKFPPDSEVYDTKTTEKIDAASGGTSGSKTFEYPFIPRSHGEFTIEPVEFSYYDVKSRKYVTVRTQELNYFVKEGEGSSYVSSDGVSIPSAAQKDVRNLAEDIRYISTRKPSLTSESAFFVGTPLFWALLAVIVLLSALVSVLIVKFRSSRSDVAMVRTKGASKMARKRLASANVYLQKQLDAAYYEELHKALLGYAAEKMNIPSSELSKVKIAEAFSSAGAPVEMIDRYIELLDKCEYARYAPAEGAVAMKETYDKAVNVISSIDSNMKKINLKAAAVVAALLMLLPSTGFSADNSRDAVVDSLWTNAIQAYAAQQYADAGNAFGEIERMGFVSPELYVNIADSKYKDNELGPAILYYERALKMDPSNSDARYNLDIARQRVRDRIDQVPEFFLKTFARKLSCTMSSNAWAVLFIVLVALASALVSVFFVARRSVVRKISFFTAIAVILLSIPCIVNSTWQKREYQNRDSAIVMRAVCGVKSAPSGTNDLFILHEGTKVKVLDTVGDWANVRICDGREGWLRCVEIELI